MERFVNAIKNYLDTENWYGAIVLSLIMPDICGKIAYPTLNTSGERYRKWFDDYLSEYRPATSMTASDCYALRCSVLHAGTDDITEQGAKDTLEKFYFSTTGSHMIRIDEGLVVNVTRFCEEVIQAIEKWCKDVEGNENTQKAIQELL
ncbi:unnamed protein product, partial [marine sediment metagenome]